MFLLSSCHPSASAGDDSEQVARPVTQITNTLATLGINRLDQSETDVIVAPARSGVPGLEHGRLVVTWAQDGHHFAASTALSGAQAPIFSPNSTIVTTNLGLPPDQIRTTRNPRDELICQGEACYWTKVCDYTGTPQPGDMKPRYDDHLSADIGIVRTKDGHLIEMGPGRRLKPREFADCVTNPLDFTCGCSEPIFDVASQFFRISDDGGQTWRLHSYFDVDALHFDPVPGITVHGMSIDRAEMFYDSFDDSLWVAGRLYNSFGKLPEELVHYSTKVLMRYDSAMTTGGQWQMVADLGDSWSPAPMASNGNGRLYVFHCEQDKAVIQWAERDAEGGWKMGKANVPLPNGVQCETLSVLTHGRDPVSLGYANDLTGNRIHLGLRNLVGNVSLSFVQRLNGRDLLRAVFPQSKVIQNGDLGRPTDRQVAHVITFWTGRKSAFVVDEHRIEASNRDGSVTFMSFTDPDQVGRVSPSDGLRRMSLLTWLETGRGFLGRVRMFQKAQAFYGQHERSDVITLTRSHGHDSHWAPAMGVKKFCGPKAPRDPDGNVYLDRLGVTKWECSLGDYEFGAFHRKTGGKLEYLRAWPQTMPDPTPVVPGGVIHAMFANRVVVGLEGNTP